MYRCGREEEKKVTHEEGARVYEHSNGKITHRRADAMVFFNDVHGLTMMFQSALDF